MRNYLLYSTLLLQLFLGHIEECSAQKKHVDGTASERFKDLGDQVMEGSIQGGTFFSNKAGETFVYTVSRGKPAHLLGFALKNNQLVTDLVLKDEIGSWDLVVSSDGWLYIAGNTGHLYKHLPGTLQVEDLGKFLTESLIFDLTAGKNGEIFGGTYSHSLVFQYHPDHGFSNVGKESMIKTEQYVRSLAYHHKSDKIYAGVGAHASLIELDPKTGIKKQLLPADFNTYEFAYNMALIPGFSTGDRLFVWLIKGDKHTTLVYNLETGKLERQFTNMQVKSAAKDPGSDKLYYMGGGQLFLTDFSKPEKQNKVLGRFKDSIALDVMWGKDKKLYVLTGDKNIIKYDPLSNKISTKSLNVPAQPIKINSLVRGPDLQIWTAGYLTGGHAAYHPKNGKIKQYPGIDQAESMTVQGQYIYMGVYPNARMYVYDTKKKWDPEKGNPRLISRIDGQDRPFAGISIPNSHKLFFGTVPRYGKLGGALLEYNPRTDQMITHPDVVKNQAVVSLTSADGTIYGGSTVRGGMGIRPTEKEARLFGWDEDKQRKIFELVPVPGARAITCLIIGPDHNIWGIADGVLFIFDPLKRRVISQLRLYPFPKTGDGVYYDAKLLVHPSGMVYGTGGGNLFQVEPNTMTYTLIRKDARLLTMDQQGLLYTVIDGRLWQYKP